MEQEPEVEAYLQNMHLGNPLDLDYDYPDLLSTSSDSESSVESNSPVKVSQISTTRVPDLVDVIHEVQETPTMPSVVKSLFALQEICYTMQISAIDYYKDLQIASALLAANLPPKGHVDGGAMTSTTDRLEYIWGYNAFSDTEKLRVPKLRVADDTVHVPTGRGFLKVPYNGPNGYLFVESYYTPEIPATILSPDSMGRYFGCQGYSTGSNFRDNTAHLLLSDCKAESTYYVDLVRIRGLLYTESLIAPSHLERAPTFQPSVDHRTPTLDIQKISSCVSG